MSMTVETIEESEVFLAQPWIAVISIPEAGHGPLSVDYTRMELPTS
jgi:hypothetical protein